MLMINYDEKLCVRCGNCATECENGGVKFINGKIVIDENCAEDWALIAEICPVGALNFVMTNEGFTNSQIIRR